MEIYHPKDKKWGGSGQWISYHKSSLLDMGPTRKHGCLIFFKSQKIVDDSYKKNHILSDHLSCKSYSS